MIKDNKLNKRQLNQLTICFVFNFIFNFTSSAQAAYTQSKKLFGHQIPTGPYRSVCNSLLFAFIFIYINLLIIAVRIRFRRDICI